MRRQSRDEQLEAIYRRIPRVACRGLCQNSCGPIGITAQERLRIVKVTGVAPKASPETMACNLLDGAGRCRAYSVRPAICRLWGGVKSMVCPHGCRPERTITREEEASILRDLEALGGPIRIDSLGILAVLSDPALRVR
jgi:hypothetical protein